MAFVEPSRADLVAHDPSSIEAVMKYLPIWMPVILILSMMAVRFYRPPPAADVACVSRAAITCEPSSNRR